MTTAEALVDVFQSLPDEEEVYCTWWTRGDIDEFLEEIEHEPSTKQEWTAFVTRLKSDDALNHAIWEVVQEYILKLVDERTQA